MKRSIILTVTNRCNIQCIYCYEDFKNSKTMSLDVAKEILRKEIKENQGGKLEVDFHGGEPLLNFNLIKELCDWSFAEDRGCKIRFLITTNGTLLTDGMKEWLLANKERVFVALSLDGTKAMHDMNRCNSFDCIDLDFFSTNWPNQPVKMTVSKKTISNIADGVIFIHNKGFKVIYNLATGVDWSLEMIEDYRREVHKLVEYYINNPSVARTINLSKKISSILSKEKLFRSCGSGLRMSSYDTDGKAYPCHMFAENALSQEEWKKIAEANFTDDTLFEDEECRDCAIYRICPTCYGMNYKERGKIGKRDKRLCEFHKIEILAICKLTYNDLINKPTEELNIDDFMELKAVKYIQERLL
ncbi:MAG: radical SAM protein [Rikenellaceae bacterium]